MILESPLILSLLIVSVGFIAGVIPFFFQWSHRKAHRWIALGGGTILGAAFLHMLPEAFEQAGRRSLTAALAGFVVLYVLEQFSLRHPHEEDEGEFYEIGFLTFIGLLIHDLVDGLALGSGHRIPDLTPAIFLALALHKIPTMFSLTLLLIHAGYTKRKILAFLIPLLLAIPLGTILADLPFALGGDQSRIVGLLIGFSAGTFIYIGAYELLPEMQRKSARGWHIGTFFLLGTLIMYLLTFVHPVF